jgi:hypothetical protein
MNNENWLNRNGISENLHESKHIWSADYKSDTEPDNVSEGLESLEQYNVGATPNVPGLIWPIWRTNKAA